MQEAFQTWYLVDGKAIPGRNLKNLQSTSASQQKNISRMNRETLLAAMKPLNP